MAEAHPSPDTQPDDSAEARTARHLRGLAELGEIGMELARLVRRQAVEQAAANPDSAVDERVGLVFARIARAVRQTFALEARLADDRRTAEAATAARHVERRKTKVRTAVERVLDAEADEGDAENLFYDLTERLETDYDDADFADRPIGELVARICRDLGVTPDWSLWQDEDWAIEAPNLLSPTRSERGGSDDRQRFSDPSLTGREGGDAGLSTAAPGPAMTHEPHRVADDLCAPWRPPPG
ncbi:MAG: hypothetical protein JWP23_947, partial [Phenylobacterium sp.]|nr:hypothetical protein [Phenylobacterium sp.]